MLIAFDPVNLLLALHLKIWINIYMRIFIIVLLVTTKNWKLPKCLKREAELLILKIEWYVAIKNQFKKIYLVLFMK